MAAPAAGHPAGLAAPHPRVTPSAALPFQPSAPPVRLLHPLFSSQDQRADRSHPARRVLPPLGGFLSQTPQLCWTLSSLAQDNIRLHSGAAFTVGNAKATAPHWW